MGEAAKEAARKKQERELARLADHNAPATPRSSTGSVQAGVRAAQEKLAAAASPKKPGTPAVAAGEKRGAISGPGLAECPHRSLRNGCGSKPAWPP